MQSTVHSPTWKVANKRPDTPVYKYYSKEIQIFPKKQTKIPSTAKPSICFYSESLIPRNILFKFTVYKIWSDQTARGYQQWKQTTKSKNTSHPHKK